MATYKPPKNVDIQFSCRAATPEDYGFILSAWLAALSNHKQFQDVDPHILRQELLSILTSSSDAVGIAEAEIDDVKVLLGCIIVGTHRDGDIPILKFAYTRRTARGIGVFTRLLETWYGFERGGFMFLATQSHMRDVLLKRMRFVYNSALLSHSK